MTDNIVNQSISEWVQNVLLVVAVLYYLRPKATNVKNRFYRAYLAYQSKTNGPKFRNVLPIEREINTYLGR
jgi:hypothetical protein